MKPRPLVAVLCLLAAGGAGSAAAQESIQSGLGRLYLGPKGGAGPQPPTAQYVAADLVGVAAPSNQWYSSVLYQRWSQPIYAQPTSFQATERGFEVSLPQREIGTYGGSREVRYLHRAAITIAPMDFKPSDARLSGRGDWHARIRMGDGTAQHLEATLLRGSPVSYYDITNGAIRLSLKASSATTQAGTAPCTTALSACISFTIDGQSWAVFAPPGTRFESQGTQDVLMTLPKGRGRFAIAALPDTAAATVEIFEQASRAFPIDTRVEWQFDPKTSKARSTFRVNTEPRDTDSAQQATTLPLLGLYPHQWSALAHNDNRAAAAASFTGHRYATVRGELRLAAGHEFTIERVYHGFTPHWGAVEDAGGRASVESLLVGDRAKADQLFMKLGRGTYWIGKGLGATAQLLSVAEAHGNLAVRDELLEKLKRRLQSWFDGTRNTHFYQDARTGTLAGLPEEYASVTSMNDHHFHYGYWVMAAAHVALRDPNWAADDQWGGMVKRIIADIATSERNRPDYPFLRNFDPYESHSWASGDANFDAGNNQESSSEAINAWAALIVWAEANDDQKLRDLGVFLFTSEIAAVEEYWFDIHERVLDKDYGQPFASMVFGGKYSYNTWWTQEPRQILGINELPITTASSYLGRRRDYFPALAARLPAEVKAYQARGGNDGTPPDIWQDIIASSVAFADPAAGVALWRRSGTVELGETRTHTNHLLLRLQELGPPDFTVTADTTLYAVFKRSDGVRTYLAWNASAAPVTVTFSDGKTLDVAPRSLAQTR